MRIPETSGTNVREFKQFLAQARARRVQPVESSSGTPVTVDVLSSAEAWKEFEAATALGASLGQVSVLQRPLPVHKLALEAYKK